MRGGSREGREGRDGRGRERKKGEREEGEGGKKGNKKIFGKLQLSCMVYVIQEILIKSAKCTLLLW